MAKFDASSISADITAELEEFEEQLAAKKKDLVAKRLKPIQDRIQELQAQRRTIEGEINELNVIESKLTGRAIDTKKSGKRIRRSEEDKLGIAKVIYDMLKKSKGNDHSSDDLKSYSDGLPVSLLIEFWNQKQTDKAMKIHSKGKKRGTRYYLPV